MRDQVSTEFVALVSAVSFQVPLGQGQSDMQGCCRVANSLYAKVQVDYGEVNRVNGQGSPCSSCWDRFHAENSI